LAISHSSPAIPARLGLIAAMPVEADALAGRLGLVPGEPCAGRPAARRPDGRVTLVTAGVGRPRARAAAEGLAEMGADALVSLGVCAALDAALAIGDVVVGTEVIAEGGRPFRAAPALLEAARAVAAGSRGLVAFGRVVTVDRAIARAREKAALAAGWGAVALEMEGEGIAAAAAARGLPFLIIRAVSDRANEDLGEALARSVAADGTVDRGRLKRELARRPWELPRLLRLRRQVARAAAAAAAFAAAWVDRLIAPGPPGR
jgi:nucleoside phosphorylase